MPWTFHPHPSLLLLFTRGPLGWLVPSEIQPLETRTAGTAINTFVNLLMTFVIGQCFLRWAGLVDQAAVAWCG